MRLSLRHTNKKSKHTNVINVTCMCNRCYTLENKKILIKLDAELMKMDFEKRKGPVLAKEKFFMISSDTDIYFDKVFFNCEVCGATTEHYVIDNKIAPAIAMLNGIGYETECCCGGHYKLDNEEQYVEYVDLPYIYFKKHLPKEALDIIPIDWDVDNSYDGTTITNSELAEVMKNKNIYPSEAEEFLQSARESLFKWIEKLPNLI